MVSSLQEAEVAGSMAMAGVEEVAEAAVEEDFMAEAEVLKAVMEEAVLLEGSKTIMPRASKVTKMDQMQITNFRAVTRISEVEVEEVGEVEEGEEEGEEATEVASGLLIITAAIR